MTRTAALLLAIAILAAARWFLRMFSTAERLPNVEPGEDERVAA